MSILENPRWELFAQGLAKGMKQVEAYRAAGYENKSALSAASILAKKPEIVARVGELTEEIRTGRREVDLKRALEVSINIESEADTAKALGITKAYLMAHLQHNIIAAQDAGQYAAANKAIQMLLDIMKQEFETTPDSVRKEKEQNGEDSINALLQLSEKLGLTTMKDVTPTDEPEKGSGIEVVEEDDDE